MPEEAFRVVGTRTVGDHGFIRVEELSIDTAAGVITRIAVRHSGAVAIVAVHDGAMLLIRQYRAAIGGPLLEIPAGKMDVDGESAASTAARELEEEVGHKAGNLRHIADFYTAPGFTDEYMQLFYATDLEPVLASPHGPEEEEAEIVAVPIGELAALLASGEVQDAKTVIGIQWLLLHGE